MGDRRVVDSRDRAGGGEPGAAGHRGDHRSDGRHRDGVQVHRLGAGEVAEAEPGEAVVGTADEVRGVRVRVLRPRDGGEWGGVLRAEGRGGCEKVCGGGGGEKVGEKERQRPSPADEGL
jgi:hypothetical protein